MEQDAQSLLASLSVKVDERHEANLRTMTRQQRYFLAMLSLLAPFLGTILWLIWSISGHFVLVQTDVARLLQKFEHHIENPTYHDGLRHEMEIRLQQLELERDLQEGVP